MNAVLWAGRELIVAVFTNVHTVISTAKECAWVRKQDRGTGREATQQRDREPCEDATQQHGTREEAVCRAKYRSQIETAWAGEAETGELNERQVQSIKSIAIWD